MTSVLVSDWLIRYSPNTRALYRMAIEKFEEHVGKDPLEATQAEIQRWIHHLSESRKLADPTVRAYASAVTSFLDYALSQGVVEHNPARSTRRPRGDVSKRQPLDMRQTTALLRAARQHSVAAEALIWLMLSGCRVSEACNADIGDLGELEVTVTVKGGDRETKRLRSRALKAVERAAGDRTRGPLLLNPNTGQRLTRKRAWDLIRKLVKKAGIRRSVTDHELRNTAAALAHQAGASIEEIQAMLGHKEIRTTQRYLKDLNRTDLANRAAGRLNDAIGEALEDLDDEEESA